MKKILVVLCTVALFLLLPLETSTAKEWSLRTTEEPNKAWKVNFNTKMDGKTVTSSNIYVADGQAIHPTKPVLINGGKTVEVRPSTPYQTGKQYTLIVTTNMKSTNGEFLKNSVEMPFKVVADSGSIIQSVDSVTSQNITVLTVVTNNDVFAVKINGDSLYYKGNNVYEYVLIGKQPGDKITINAYDDKNKVIEKLPYTIGE